MLTAEPITNWMRRQLSSTAAGGFVVGLSGGVDSAVVARLAQLAAPANAVAAILPCHSDPEDERDAAAIAAHFSLTTVRVDLSEAYDTTIGATQAAVQMLAGQSRGLKRDDAIQIRRPLANVKPRLRMTALYFTKHGDGASDLLPIGHLVKSEVRSLARELNVPPAIIERTPSAGLWIGQSDEEEMGFTYAQLERYLDEGPQGVSPAIAMKIERLIRSSEHKRALPPIPEL
jgi:NAD+ synthase